MGKRQGYGGAEIAANCLPGGLSSPCPAIFQSQRRWVSEKTPDSIHP